MQRGTCRPTNRCQLQREQWRRTIDAVPTETSSEDIPTADAELSPAMLRRLERVSAEEESAGMDPLVADPAVDVDMYRRAMRRRVAESVLTRHRIYLDMNYWIWLRDAALGQPARPIYADLWEHRIQLVRSGRVLCPVTYPVYREVLKQDSASRQRTALVIDQLCGGVCIVEQLARITLQLSHFVWTELLGDQTLPPPDRFIWAPVSHVAGMPHPDSPNLPSDLNRFLQKRWLRMTQFMRFSDLIEGTIGWVKPTSDELHTLIQNLMSNWTRESLRSLKSVYTIEVGNMTDIIAREIVDFAQDLFRQGVRTPLGPEASPADLAVSLACIITTGLKMGRITKGFPQYHIMGVIHATNRWMRRPHDPNDLMDHQHATAALPYCDAFFTERGLRDTLTRGPFHLDQTYKCRVISDPSEALTYLKDIAS